MAYKDKAKRSANQKKRCQRNRDELVELLGGKCVVCGATEDLQFHHKDPSKKVFTIGAAIRGTKDDRLAEAMKCELRCQDHHAEAHTKPHGDPNKKCRCDLCRQARRKYNRLWMKRWRALKKKGEVSGHR